MGDYMLEDDIYIPSLLELLNLRFAPNPEPALEGGITEVAALQKAFQIFKEGRSFKDSIAILNLGGTYNARARSRWYKLLGSLAKSPSTQAGQNGDQRIVAALVDNLAARRPLPVYFKAHDARENKQVLVGDAAEKRPIFYIEQDYLTVSLPMKPKSKEKPKPKPKPKGK